jgi:hypothetical protein
MALEAEKTEQPIPALSSIGWTQVNMSAREPADTVLRGK